MSKTVLKPLRDRIVVRKLEPKTETTSGLILPDNVSDRVQEQEGEVIAVGTGHMLASGDLRPLEVNVGDHILYQKSSAVKIQVDDGDLFMVQENGVLAVIVHQE